MQDPTGESLLPAPIRVVAQTLKHDDASLVDGAAVIASQLQNVPIRHPGVHHILVYVDNECLRNYDIEVRPKDVSQ